jgi:hypothetical protein
MASGQLLLGLVVSAESLLGQWPHLISRGLGSQDILLVATIQYQDLGVLYML